MFFFNFNLVIKKIIWFLRCKIINLKLSIFNKCLPINRSDDLLTDQFHWWLQLTFPGFFLWKHSFVLSISPTIVKPFCMITLKWENNRSLWRRHNSNTYQLDRSRLIAAPFFFLSVPLLQITLRHIVRMTREISVYTARPIKDHTTPQIVHG